MSHMDAIGNFRPTFAPPLGVGSRVSYREVEGRRRALTLSVVLDEQERRRRLAYAIRSAREKRKLSPPQLADRLGVGRGSINKWESGESVPSLLWLGPLCDALGLDANLFAVLPPIPQSPVDDYLTLTPEEAAALRAVDAVSEERPKPRGGAAPIEGAKLEQAHD